ncbi:MAG: hypothetical protein NT011_13785 [Kiritimatiellaeota bacterium]|nr:hypothetical protein [Kiritimatiellota bacterium]
MIEQIYLINLSHYDIGFTDHPVVCRELQVRYLDMAINLTAKNTDKNPERWFYWTCESNDVVLNWWQKASAKRRELFLELVRKGWIEVCAMPFNHHPTLDKREWNCLTHWLPEELWRAIKPRTIIQDDVNGFPRAGIMALMNAGAEFLWMGLNCDTGGSPMMQPGAYWWTMPDGRRIFIWNSIAYPGGYYLFESREWRKGPLPQASDTRYRPPQEGDFFRPTPENLQKAHEICSARIHEWQKAGFALDSVAVSMTNQWRIDNDPPCDLIPDFVAAWNAEGLMPKLIFTTATKALEVIRASAANIPVISGEWTDWWANGIASTPRELSASRKAKRILDALESPLYSTKIIAADTVDRCTRRLCRFDEHTWGSWNSAALPESLDTKGQFAEKAALAYRPLAEAELLLGDANRAVCPKDKGVHVINPYPALFTGWVEFPDDCLRGDFEGAEDTITGKQLKFDRMSGVSAFYTIPKDFSQFTPADGAKVFPDNIAGKRLRLWVDEIPPNGIRSFRLLQKAAHVKNSASPVIETDKTNWPVAIRWDKTSLFTSSIGDFTSLEFFGPFPRWKYKEILGTADSKQRNTMCRKESTLVRAEPGAAAIVRDTGPTIRYEQYCTHPKLRWMKRTLEVFKVQPRVQLYLSFSRLPKPESAEIFYASFPLDCRGCETWISSGGLPFRPDKDVLAKACRDYFAIDDTVTYVRKDHSRVVLRCHDNCLVAFGGANDGLMLENLPAEKERLFAILYNNIWYTNWAGDEAGLMTFEFDLYAGSDFAPAAFPVVNV